MAQGGRDRCLSSAGVWKVGKHSREMTMVSDEGGCQRQYIHIETSTPSTAQAHTLTPFYTVQSACRHMQDEQKETRLPAGLYAKQRSEHNTAHCTPDYCAPYRELCTSRCNVHQTSVHNWVRARDRDTGDHLQRLG